MKYIPMETLSVLIAGNTEMPDAMETIFQSALAFGRHGGVSISSCFSFHPFWPESSNPS